ncbi:putative malonyl CoA-acyl carrier protein transacylase [Vibrio nigripulchritudo SOn1]|uniref:Malonyl CoA-acyl carrier protein transacylase n=1 Tax=Vibrio nigripulchritudo SOn1 TaxID=1238450 RepID=A0AAV2VS44_9VIBR|nr:malonyl CoA-ACP transacylase [Vibrio nigripulchritudo]CCO47565.1 putative malonyl CoA-acyl carrier protein transacylase [Vibrio nigripulchritudo SOn1]
MNKYSIVFGPADVSHNMEDMQVLVKRHLCVAKRFNEVAEYSGISVNALLKKEETPSSVSNFQLSSLGLMAGMLGIADYIKSTHGAPESVGGVSLGELVALCFSSAISLKDTISIILNGEEKPHDRRNEPEGVGFVFIPNEVEHFASDIERINVAVDYGQIQGGIGRLVMLSGLRKDLEKAAQESLLDIDVLPEELCNTAYHSPLRGAASLKISSLLEGMELNRCDYPVNTCFKDLKRLSEAEDVKSAITKNDIETLYLDELLEQQKQDKLDNVVCIGPFLRSLELNFFLPTEYFDQSWVENN